MRAKRSVIEGEFTVDIEDCDAGRQLIENTAVRLDHACKFGTHDFYFCTVDRDARTAGTTRHINDFEHATLARHDGWQPAGICLACGASACDIGARGLVEQLQPARHCIGRSFSLYRMRISRIYKDELASGVARPHGGRQRIKQRPHSFDIAQQLVVARREIQQFLLDATYVTQSQHCASADGASFRFYRTSRAGGERHYKAAAVATQSVHRLLHTVGGHGIEPNAECKNSFGDTSGCGHRGVTKDLWLLGVCRPGHHYLRLR